MSSLFHPFTLIYTIMYYCFSFLRSCNHSHFHFPTIYRRHLEFIIHPLLSHFFPIHFLYQMEKWEIDSISTPFTTQVDDVRQPGFLPCLEKPTQNGGMKPTSWNSIARVFFRFAPIGKIEKTRFERNWTTFVNPAYALLGKAHSKWWYETDPMEFDPKGFFSFEPNWTTFVNPAFCPASKRPLKIVVCNRPRGIRS